MTQQATTNEIIRSLILEMAQANGGLKGIAEKAKIGYSALWNQMNRGKGILAYTIPGIVNGTGDVRLLHRICEPCGFIPTQSVK
ncbi:unnamed protein product, partial [marine sediment metagenome]